MAAREAALLAACSITAPSPSLLHYGYRHLLFSSSLRRRTPSRIAFSHRPPSLLPRASMSSLLVGSAAGDGAPYRKELAAAKKAVSLASRLCQDVQKELLQSDVHSKADKSPVTVADYGSQVLISVVLRRELPSESFSMVAEEDSEDLRKEGSGETLKRITEAVNRTLEGTYSDGAVLSEGDVLAALDDGKSGGGPHGRHWVLDPIDGTKGFVRGDQYAIALALLDGGRVVLGVLACPNLPYSRTPSLPGNVGCLFSAVSGCGAAVESLDGSSSTEISVCDTDNPADASFFESFESAHSMQDLTGAIAKKLGVTVPPVRIDSQAKYGALARGDGAIYMRFPRHGYREKIWDHAAGFIVVTEAGGIVTDAAGNVLDFSRGRYLELYAGIVASNRKLMPALLTAVLDATGSASTPF